MNLNDIRRDSDAVEKGQWVGDKYGTPIPQMGGLQLKVRGDENADWRRLRDRLLGGIPRNRRIDGRLRPEDADNIMATCLLDACLIDWEGIDSDGEPVPYSREQAKELLTNPEFREFRDAVMWAASIVGTRMAEAREDDAKN